MDIGLMKWKNMNVNYKKLWEKSVDNGMTKTKLREQAGLFTIVIDKKGKNENISTEVLCKNCKALVSQINDIMELVEENVVLSP